MSDEERREGTKKAFYEVENQSWHSLSSLKQLMSLVKFKKNMDCFLLMFIGQWGQLFTLHHGNNKHIKRSVVQTFLYLWEPYRKFPPISRAVHCPNVLIRAHHCDKNCRLTSVDLICWWRPAVSRHKVDQNLKWRHCKRNTIITLLLLLLNFLSHTVHVLVGFWYCFLLQIINNIIATQVWRLQLWLVLMHTLFMEELFKIHTEMQKRLHSP